MPDELPSGTYNGQSVLIVRPATGFRQSVYGDMGFKDDGTEQVLVRFEDNHEEVVARAEVA